MGSMLAFSYRNPLRSMGHKVPRELAFLRPYIFPFLSTGWQSAVPHLQSHLWGEDRDSASRENGIPYYPTFTPWLPGLQNHPHSVWCSCRDPGEKGRGPWSIERDTMLKGKGCLWSCILDLDCLGEGPVKDSDLAEMSQPPAVWLLKLCAGVPLGDTKLNCISLIKPLSHLARNTKTCVMCSSAAEAKTSPPPFPQQSSHRAL